MKSLKTLVIILAIVVPSLLISGCTSQKSPELNQDKKTNTNLITEQPQKTTTEVVTPVVKTEVEPVKNSSTKAFDWKVYQNIAYGYELKYPNTELISVLDRDNDRIYVSNIKIGEITTRVLSKANLGDCANKISLVEQVKCNYLVLQMNVNSISQQKFGDNSFVYADFEAIDHPNAKNRIIWAFAENDNYIYEFEILNPTADQKALFEDVISSFRLIK